MRDILVTLAVFGSLPFILKRPWIGILVWTWLAFMNPHRMAWGFSTSMPFAYIVAMVTLGAMLFNKEDKRIPWERESVVLLLFVIWMFITTIFAVYPTLAWAQFEKVIKIQVMIFVAMMLITTPERLKYLVWTIALSIAFYGVKGGIFTIVHGGVYRVEGPPGTFIAGNNELGLAMAMTVPLLYFMARSTHHRWGRPAVYGAMVLTALAAIGTQSRGALLGMAAMGVMFWLKARNKFLILVLGLISIGLVLLIMPPEWTARMNTIETYQEDASAMGRINAWWMAFNLAKSRFFGGGFETFQWQMFALYAPNPDDARDVHSIYFEVLGEHGFVGLFLFLLLLFLTWRSASRLRKIAPPSPDMDWIPDLVMMVQVSMVAYLTAGAFLGMAYFDFPYNLVLVVIAIQSMYKRTGVSVKGGDLPISSPRMC
ncbi:MAG: putative O-glycosylation ligase, exosortase A system-associated [Rhodocyclaceae bacterium]|jgi:probable O-glycosylation ligase (exosortase A-associated)|nr:putative O-glycosylation ligase, exosortase A system-associated [Rhodocyclaceae bacterium]